MWDAVDDLVARAPGPRALRYHRLQLLYARRRLALGLALDPEIAAERDRAVACLLTAPLVLARARAAWDGPLVLIKGLEAALDYPAPATRPLGDLDLLTDDAPGAQRALLAAGFQEVGEPSVYAGIHHLRPLWWPGSPLTVELHKSPKWPQGLPVPPTPELLRHAVRGRAGVAGIDALPAAAHAVVLAAHAWAHEPLARAGQLVDVAATLARADRDEADALARAWHCARMWRTVARAAGWLLQGERSVAGAVWARHLHGARERTVAESHAQGWLAPLWGRPASRAAGAAVRRAASDLRCDGTEPWRTKLRRTRMALADAGLPRSEHQQRLEQVAEETA